MNIVDGLKISCIKIQRATAIANACTTENSNGLL